MMKNRIFKSHLTLTFYDKTLEFIYKKLILRNYIIYSSFISFFFFTFSSVVTVLSYLQQAEIVKKIANREILNFENSIILIPLIPLIFSIILLVTTVLTFITQHRYALKKIAILVSYFLQNFIFMFLIFYTISTLKSDNYTLIYLMFFIEFIFRVFFVFVNVIEFLEAFIMNKLVILSVWLTNYGFGILNRSYNFLILHSVYVLFTSIYSYFYIKQLRVNFFYNESEKSKYEWCNSIIENMNSGFLYIKNNQVQSINKKMIEIINKNEKYLRDLKESQADNVDNKDFESDKHLMLNNITLKVPQGGERNVFNSIKNITNENDLNKNQEEKCKNYNLISTNNEIFLSTSKDIRMANKNKIDVDIFEELLIGLKINNLLFEKLKENSIHHEDYSLSSKEDSKKLINQLKNKYIYLNDPENSNNKNIDVNDKIINHQNFVFLGNKHIKYKSNENEKNNQDHRSNNGIKRDASKNSLNRNSQNSNSNKNSSKIVSKTDGINEDFYYEVNLRFYENHEGENFEIIINDITRIKTYENKNAEFKYKTIFLSKVAHEFKNPLICIVELIDQIQSVAEIGNNKFFNNNSKIPADHVHINNNYKDMIENENYKINYNTIINESEKLPQIKFFLKDKLFQIKGISNYLIMLIKDLDYFSLLNLKDANIKLEKSNCDLLEILAFIDEIAMILLRRANKQSRIQFIINKEDSVKNLIYTDELKLKQILINLLSNSIKFTEQGEIRLEIKKSKLNKNETIFYFIDTGKGFDKLEIQYPFQKKASNKNNYLGAGLGLYIISDLTTRLGSLIQYESQKGKGSTFWFSLTEENQYLNNNKFQESKFNFKNKKANNSFNKIEGTDDVKNNSKDKANLNMQLNMNDNNNTIKCHSSGKGNINYLNFRDNIKLKRENSTYKAKKEKTDENVFYISIKNQYFYPAKNENHIKDSFSSNKTKLFKKNFNLDIKTKNEMFKGLNKKEESNFVDFIDKQISNISGASSINSSNNHNYLNENKSLSLKQYSEGKLHSFKEIKTQEDLVSIISFTDFERDFIKKLKKPNPYNARCKTSILADKKEINIIMCDDEELTRKASIRILQKLIDLTTKLYNYKFNLLEANDGLECLSIFYLLKKFGKDIFCIISDESMSYMNGSECSVLLRKLENKNNLNLTPFYLISAYPKDTFIEYRNYSVTEIFNKPLKPHDILKIFESLL